MTAQEGAAPGAAAMEAASTCAVVVTHDGDASVRRCLSAVAGQTVSAQQVLVVDNGGRAPSSAASEHEASGGTILRLEANQGSAGGFHEGLRWAHEQGYQWYWLLEHDAIPAPDALEALLAAASSEPGSPLILASLIVGADGCPRAADLPSGHRKRLDDVIAACQRRLLLIRSASFVSLLVHREAVDRYGLPLKRFFRFQVDVEYTARVLRTEDGLLVPTSRVIHCPRDTRPDRTATYLDVRNRLAMLGTGSWTSEEKLRILAFLGRDLAARRLGGHGRTPHAHAAQASGRIPTTAR